MPRPMVILATASTFTLPAHPCGVLGDPRTSPTPARSWYRTRLAISPARSSASMAAGTPERGDHVTVTQSFIGGESVASRDVYDNVDPATGRSIGGVARGGLDEIDRAVAAARAASTGWRATTPAERSRVLTRFADLIDGELNRLALMESEDTGKPLSQPMLRWPPGISASTVTPSTPITATPSRCRRTFMSTRVVSPSALPGTSSPGTTRCNCCRGPSPPRLRQATAPW